MQKKRQIGPFRASKESFVPHMRREGVSRESFVPKRQGVVLVGRVVLCSGVVLVPVGGLWRRPGAAHAHCGRPLRAPGVLHAGGGGGFALHDALLRRVAGVSDPRVVQFPPTGGGADAVRGCVATKVQTHWVKNGEKSLLWLNESTFWRIRPLAWCGIRTRATPPLLRSNVARNSPTTASKAELPSLELQRLQAISESDRIKLRATFGRGHP